jgi:predicted house-cleaning noncanonical NTP pyrophosphatase (MazG superfamily)
MVRLLAAELSQNPYMTLGQYFQNANETDLELIMEISEDENDERMSDLLLMAEMMAKAEGVETEDMDEVAHHLNSFISLAAVTLLDRKNLVDAYYSNMSLGSEFGKSIVAARKQ